MLSPKYFRLLFLLISISLFACGSETEGGEGVCTDSADRSGYPEGDYGVKEGDTLANHSFQDSDGNEFALGRLYQDSAARLLLISTGAGWCTACIEEQPQLEAWAAKYKDQGLKVVMTVFEDANTIAADVAYANKWKSENNLTIPVLADGDAQFSSYYDASLAPMNMIVEACTMKIVRIIIGADASAIEAIIEAKL